ncbi:MAG TPA: biotin/lipoyl-containing protein [Verrucomicrobiae bacterium]|nr:biotin/lipoyl-containing protein [Verrucomicrobiae bacterium]
MSTRKFSIVLPNGQSTAVEMIKHYDRIEVRLDGEPVSVSKSRLKGKILRQGKQILVSTPQMQGVLEIVEPGRKAAPTGGAEQTALAATFPGRVVKLLVGPKRWVNAGEMLVVLEAMKMEFSFRAPEKIFIEEVLVKEGEVLEKGRPFFKCSTNDK